MRPKKGNELKQKLVSSEDMVRVIVRGVSPEGGRVCVGKDL